MLFERKKRIRMEYIKNNIDALKILLEASAKFLADNRQIIVDLIEKYVEEVEQGFRQLENEEKQG
ncbi:MAG: hypothetical protein QXI58_01870 [Candidatus Micrarchaeia archaeon]